MVLILGGFCCSLQQRYRWMPAAQATHLERLLPVLYDRVETFPLLSTGNSTTKICNASTSEEWCDVQGCVVLHRFARGAPGAGADHLRPAAVTLATQLDERLLDRLATVSMRWGGPVSAAIALQAVPGGGELRALCSALRSLPLNVDVHLLHPLPARAAASAAPPYNQVTPPPPLQPEPRTRHCH